MSAIASPPHRCPTKSRKGGHVIPSKTELLALAVLVAFLAPRGFELQVGFQLELGNPSPESEFLESEHDSRLRNSRVSGVLVGNRSSAPARAPAQPAFL